MALVNLGKTELIAPCGINCGVCAAYLREKNKCLGCRGNDSGKPVTRVRCRIKTCKVFKDGSAKFCFECAKFPCADLIRLDKRYSTNYKMSVIGNLDNINKIGLEKFIINEKKKWICQNCREILSIHKKSCLNCGMILNSSK
jgi:hypothetical protein